MYQYTVKCVYPPEKSRETLTIILSDRELKSYQEETTLKVIRKP